MLCHFSGSVGDCYCVGGEKETSMAKSDLGGPDGYEAMLGVIVIWAVLLRS